MIASRTALLLNLSEGDRDISRVALRGSSLKPEGAAELIAEDSDDVEAQARLRRADADAVIGYDDSQLVCIALEPHFYLSAGTIVKSVIASIGDQLPDRETQRDSYVRGEFDAIDVDLYRDQSVRACLQLDDAMGKIAEIAAGV